jgi:hypothetical protein
MRTRPAKSEGPTASLVDFPTTMLINSTYWAGEDVKRERSLPPAPIKLRQSQKISRGDAFRSGSSTRFPVHQPLSRPAQPQFPLARDENPIEVGV